jgi:hypothetical protein
MKFTTPSSLLALAAASSVSAQSYTNQSAPFTLQIANSANASINGLYLYSCHSGAALEGICLGGTTPNAGTSSTFYYNTTDTDTDPNPNPSGISEGLLVWNLPIGSDVVESQAASLNFYNAGTNVVTFEFGFNAGRPVHFTDDNKMTIPDYYNDANYVQGQFPASTPDPTIYNQWYVCWTGVGVGYTYEALAWVTAGEPNNPTCQKVDVVRTFL